MDVLSFANVVIFFVLGMSVFVLPKRNDLYRFSENLWRVGVFALLRGVDELLELFISSVHFSPRGLLTGAHNLLFTASYFFLFSFGIKTLCREKVLPRWVCFIWPAVMLPWFFAFFFRRDPLLSEIALRYSVVFPAGLLTALAIGIRIRRIPPATMLPLVRWFGFSIAFLFCLYGVLAGLIVPRASFFPATVLNIASFTDIFKVSPRFFQTLCVLLVTSNFFIILNMLRFLREGVAFEGGLRRKTITFLLVLLFFLGMIYLGLGFYWGSSLFSRLIGYDHEQAAGLLATSVSHMIDAEVQVRESESLSPLWRKMVSESNIRMAGMDEASRQRFFLHMDKKWVAEPAESAFFEPYFNNENSRALQDIVEQQPQVAEIFLTDRFGGVVASSEKISDFYQADEEWWQRVFSQGKGMVYCGDISLDEPSGQWSMMIAVPIRDEEGSVIGVCNSTILLSKFFEPLQEFSIGKSGYPLLIDSRGQIFYRHDFFIQDRLSLLEFDYRDLMKKPFESGILYSSYRSKKMFFTLAPIKNSLLEKQGVDWYVLLEQDAAEIFAPLKSLILLLGSALVGVLLFLYPLWLFFGAVFVKPIQKLHEATRHIAKKEWDYRVDIRTGDELQGLGDAFNEMVAHLKATTASIADLNREIEERKAVEKALLVSQEKVREVQNRLLQAAKMEAVGRMAAGVAHEVKNPLGIILQGINYLEGALPPDQKESCEIVKLMKDGVLRANKIISILLDFSRAGKLTLESRDINQVLESSFELVAHLLREKNIEVIKDFEKGLPLLFLDKGKMEQVLINIYTNAIQAVSDGGRLHVVSLVREIADVDYKVGNRQDDVFRVGEKVVEVRVEDNGIGMDEETKKKSFEPFFTTKNRVEGTGLGLSVCKSIIEMHGGSIAVESEKGKGTQVILWFKLREELI